jgi:dihydroflavonol-4-reductase
MEIGMSDTVLVTGGTGYVAGWCVAELLNRGYAVRTTVRGSNSEDSVRALVSTQIDAPNRLSFAVADLNSDAGWDKAVMGCRYVLHVASPMSAESNPEIMISAARDGAVRLLRAATNAGVERVVMTSAANASSPTSYTEDGITDETLWTDLADATLAPYRRAKTIAEKTAWEFMEASGGSTSFTTVLPGAVFGPVLGPGSRGSVQVIGKMLRGEMPGTPRIGLEVVDVRDIADIHIRAMTSPVAGGQRFLATGEFMWMGDIAKILKANLGADAAKVSTRVLPDLAVRLLSKAKPELRSIMPGLGRRNRHTTAKAQELLHWTSRSGADTVVDCARSLIQHGMG